MINHDAARHSANLTAKLKEVTAEARTAKRGLRQIAARIEAHAQRSILDFALLVAGMAVAGILAGGGAIYWTKQNLNTANFQGAIELIRNDSLVFWCDGVQASIVQTAGEKSFCAVAVPKYQIPREEEG